MSEKLKIGFWVNSDKGGIYDVLGNFGNSFSKALSKVADIIPIEKIVDGTYVNAMFSFNSTGYDSWEKAINSNVKNVIWTVDSFFYSNFYLFNEFSANDNFILLDVVPSDKFPITEYVPDFKHCNYFPHAVDLDFWKPKRCKKENDVVFFGTIIDVEKALDELKQKYPEDLFKIIIEMKNLSLVHPDQPFWTIYQSAKKCYGLELEKEMYHEIFTDLADICEFEQRITMIQKLSKFNVKVYGKGPWEKYIKGNVKYCGRCSAAESVDIMNKSKISLHIQPMKLACGMHERFLNAAAAKTFTIMGSNQWIEQEFGDSFGYFNLANFDDIQDVVSDYLNNKDKRNEHIEKAYTIVKNNHTWDNRANDFVKLFD